MGTKQSLLNPVVTAIFLLANVPSGALADGERAAELLQELKREDLPNWKQVEEALLAEWSKSGSASIDLLLKRGREAVEDGDFETALEHFSAVTDHAPDFAEGYNARALAYFRSGLYGPALADLRHVLALNPNHFGALSGLGAILEETGRYDAALAAFSAAHAIHPHDPDLEEALERLEVMTSGRTL